MSWFSQDTFDFFRELEENNNKPWFEANRKRYEQSVKLPMLAFTEEMIGRMLELDPNVVTDAKKSIMRQHRDTRFSKDKAPYRICASMVISSGGKGDHGTPGLFFSLTATQVFMASGAYMVEPDQLLAIRRHIVAHPGELDALRAEPEFVRLFQEIQGERNKVLPAEFKEASSTLPLLFNKQFFYAAQLGPEVALRDDFPDLVMSYMRAAWPLNRFFMKAMGI